MKVERLTVLTPAFTAQVRVQNGRVVYASKPIAWAARGRISQLEDWLMKHHPDAWFVTEGGGKVPRYRDVIMLAKHHAARMEMP